MLKRNTLYIIFLNIHCPKQQLQKWAVPKKINMPPTEEIFTILRGGGYCLKNVLYLYMINFLNVEWRDMDLFCNNPMSDSAIL